MAYRLRRRPGLTTRWRLTLDAINAAMSGDLPREGWLALREPLVRRFGGQLEGLEAYWRFEDVPDWLRTLPDDADAALRAAVQHPDDRQARRDFDAAETARQAVLAGRRAHLRGHPAT